MTENVTIIAPCRNEANYIESFIKSILTQDYPLNNTEILLIDGNSNDGTKEVIEKYSAKYPSIKYVLNTHQTVPFALNEGIRSSTGEIIIRMDAHAEYPSNYVSVLVEKLKSLNADNVGAPIETVAADNSSLAKSIAFVTSHPFGVGNSYFRIGSTKIQEVDTVPFGCFSKKIFDRIGLFDEELIRNQDDEFNGRLKKSGGKIFLIPTVQIKYFARDSIKKLWKMFFQYGLFKPLVNKKLGSPATVRQFVPLLFVIGLVIGGLLSMVSPYAFYFYLAVIGVYLLTGLLAGTKAAVKEKDFIVVLLVPFLFATVHIAYGLGYLKGIKKLLFKEQFNKIRINR